MAGTGHEIETIQAVQIRGASLKDQSYHTDSGFTPLDPQLER